MADFPQRIYVRIEPDENDPETTYLVAEDNTDGAEDGDTVAIYDYNTTRTARVTTKLE